MGKVLSFKKVRHEMYVANLLPKLNNDFRLPIKVKLKGEFLDQITIESQAPKISKHSHTVETSYESRGGKKLPVFYQEFS